MADSDSGKHDEYDEKSGQYKKRCYCQKCVKTYNEWCKRQKEHGNTRCRRKCFTVCTIECEKDHTVTTRWGYDQKFEGKWEDYKHARPAPRDCKDKKKDDCTSASSGKSH